MCAHKPSYRELQDRLHELEKAAQVHEIVEAHLAESENIELIHATCSSLQT